MVHCGPFDQLQYNKYTVHIYKVTCNFLLECVVGIALWSTAGLHCEAMWRDVVWYYVNPCEIAKSEAFLDQIEID